MVDEAKKMVDQAKKKEGFYFDVTQYINRFNSNIINLLDKKSVFLIIHSLIHLSG